jgi:predicted dehydrogenase
VRTLIVGLGNQGKKRWTVAGCDVCAIVDPVAPANFRDVRDVPHDKYDAACVCIPDDVKLDVMHYLLKHGKHVLVEKPLIGEEDDLRELEELGRRRRLACYTAYNHRFEPHICRLKAAIDRGELGDLYSARFMYGNGTAQDVRHSPWRDRGLGVLSDLGSHLLDLAAFLLGRPEGEAKLLYQEARETRAPDHAVFGIDGAVSLLFEVSLLSWRNTFTVDIVGSKGSVHLDGLCKWGDSTLTLRQRVWPSGKPLERKEVLQQPDPTWAEEYRHFQRLCAAGRTDLDNDVWINSVLEGLMPYMEVEIGA